MVRNATEVVVACENTLGWVPDESKPLWQARAIAASILKKTMTKHKVTLEQVELAIEYCRRKRQHIKQPASLVFYVERALEMANEPVVVSDLTTAVEEALRWEQMNEDHFSLGWITRLTRATSDYRGEVLSDWKAAGRGC